MISMTGIRYLGAQPYPVRLDNGSSAPGFRLMFSLPNGEVHYAYVEQKGFTKAIGEAAIIAAATPFLELQQKFSG